MKSSLRVWAIFGGVLAFFALTLMMGPTGGLPSRPRFQAVTIGAGTAAQTNEIRVNNATTFGTYLNGPRPVVKLNETESAVDNRMWYMQVDGNFFTIRTVDDAEAVATNPVVIERAGTTVPSLILAATTVSFQGTTVLAATEFLRQNGISPSVQINETDAAANNRLWHVQGTGEQFLGRACTDGVGSCQNFLTVDRTSDTIDIVNLTGTTVQVNGTRVPRETVTETAISGAGMLVGDTITISKSAATSRANDATDTNDPNLQITALPAGHYLVDFQANLNAGAGGARYRLEAPTASSTLYGVNNCASTVTAVNGSFDGLITCAGTLRASSRGASAKLQATGTVAISWGQNTSNAANTTLEPDSYLRVTRID